MLIDDRGRLFGKLNIVDAAVVLVICLLIPLTYGAYLLFRPALPRLVAVEPARVVVGTMRVNIRGEYFRPSLRLLVGDFGARFLLADSENGVLELPSGIGPGSYDVVLIDEAQELGRLPGALTVYTLSPSPNAAPSPNAEVTAEVTALGAFVSSNLVEAQVLLKRLQDSGQNAARSWDVLALQAPEAGVVLLPSSQRPLLTGGYQVRAVLGFRCVLRQSGCSTFDVGLAPGAIVPVPFGAEGAVAGFRVDALSPAYAAAFASTELMVVGTFGAPDAAEAEALRKTLQAAGQDAARSWDVLDVQSPQLYSEEPQESGVPLSSDRYRMRAVLRFRCVSWQGQCAALGVGLLPGAIVPVPSGAEGAVAGFRIESLRPASTEPLTSR